MTARRILYTYPNGDTGIYGSILESKYTPTLAQQKLAEAREFIGRAYACHDHRERVLASVRLDPPEPADEAQRQALARELAACVLDNDGELTGLELTQDAESGDWIIEAGVEFEEQTHTFLTTIRPDGSVDTEELR